MNITELKESAQVITYGEGANEYGYTITFHDAMEYPEGSIMLVDGESYAGVIRGSDPCDAARNVLRARSDILDGDFGYVLEPVFEVWRNSDGSFTVEIDTHGLGDATVQLLAS